MLQVGSINWCRHLRKWTVSVKTQYTCIPFQPGSSTPRYIYPTEMCINMHRIFKNIHSNLIVSQNRSRKQLSNPSIVEWINKLWYIILYTNKKELIFHLFYIKAIRPQFFKLLLNISGLVIYWKTLYIPTNSSMAKNILWTTTQRN